MLKLLVHIKKYKKECILGPLFKLLEALLELFVPLVIASIIDDGIAQRRPRAMLSEWYACSWVWV